MDGRLQGPSDRSGLHKERRGVRQQPGMAQIGGWGKGDSERTENPRTRSPKGGPVPFTFTAKAPGRRGGATLSACKRQGLE